MKEKIISGIEYGLGLLFVWGGINTIFADPLVTQGLFYFLLAGNSVVIILYAIIFFVTGAALIVSKVRKRRKLHGYSLLSMYLTCIYVLILSVALLGIHTDLITTVAAGAVSAALWLRWKFKTEYINPKQFRDELHNI